MHDPWMRGYKVAFAFFAAGCVALAATGLATLPRGRALVLDLADRLDSASGLVSEVLAASDGLHAGAAGLRPLLVDAVVVLQRELDAEAFAADVQATSSMLDSAFAAPNEPSALSSQLSYAAVALQTAVADAVATAIMALRAIEGLGGSTSAGSAALAVVAAAPSLLFNISTSLGAYTAALTALPAARQPSSESDPALVGLQAAQGALTLPSWNASLGALYDGVLSTASAAQQLPYIRLAAALQTLRIVANATAIGVLAPLTVPLARLDGVIAGPQAGNHTTGIVSLARMAQRAARFEDAVFRFKNGSSERRAVDAVLTLEAATEQLYGREAGEAGGASAMPATGVVARAQLALSPLAAADTAAIARGCAAVQACLSDSAMPDSTPLLSYITSLMAALAALQPAAAQVAASLDRASLSDDAYSELYGRTSLAAAAAASMHAQAASALPEGGSSIISAASNAAAAVAAASFGPGGALDASRNDTRLLAAWLADSHPGAVLLRSATALSGVQRTLMAAEWDAGAASGSSSAAPSAFMQPLLQSVRLIHSTVSNGIAAVADQLDNALGRSVAAQASTAVAPASASSFADADTDTDVTGSDGGSGSDSGSPSSDGPTPAPNSAVIGNLTSASATTAAAPLNATSQVRQQLLRRLDRAAATLRGDPARRYAAASYWPVLATYCCVVTVVLLLGLTALFNFPAGLVTLLALHLLLSCVVLCGAWAAAASMVVAYDACGSSDAMVLAAVSPSSALFPLTRFYLQGVGGTLPAVLRTAGLGDTARLAAAVETVEARLLRPMLLPSAPAATAAGAGDVWPGSLGAVQYVLGGVLVDMSTAGRRVAETLAELLQAADRAVVVAQYDAVRSWACCGLAGELFVAWVCATGCGLLAWMAGVSCVFILKNLDDLPVSSCCGCACYSARDFPRPQRGRGAGGSSGGGGAGGSGGGATKTSQHNKVQPRSSLRPVSRGGGTGGGGVSSGGGAAVTATAVITTAARAGAGGRVAKGGAKEVVVESGLFQGPIQATEAANAAAAAAAAATALTAPEALAADVHAAIQAAAIAADSALPVGPQRPSVVVCVMDDATAAAFGYDDEGRQRAAAALEVAGGNEHSVVN